MTNYSPAAAATFMVALPILMNLLLFSGQISSSKYQKELHPSEMLSTQTRFFANFLATILDDEYGHGSQKLLLNYTSFTEWLNSAQFTASIGISVDPEGKADTKNSMVYLWGSPTNMTGNGTSRSPANSMQNLQHFDDDQKVFKDSTTLFSRSTPTITEIEGRQQQPPSSNHRYKRAPKSSGGGGRGASGARGGGGRFSGPSTGAGGRGSSGRSFKAGLSGAWGTGVGGARPHVWMFINTNRPYIWTDDEEYDYGADPSSDGIRMEISLCFGRHKSREGCSAKVDAMLEKLALEKKAPREFPWIFLGVVLLILILICIFVAAGKMAQY